MIQSSHSARSIRQSAIFKLNEAQNQGHIKIVQVILRSIFFRQPFQVIQMRIKLGVREKVAFQMLGVMQKIVNILNIVFHIEDFTLQEFQAFILVIFRHAGLFNVMSEVFEAGQHRCIPSP